MPAEPDETVIPLFQEHLVTGKRVRETGRVRVSVHTGSTMRLVEETLRHCSTEVERVPVGRVVAEPPPVREEGDTLVIPVLEEMLVVERRLVLREEVRVRRRVEDRRHAEAVLLRRQDVTIERLPAAVPETPDTSKDTNTMQTITGFFDSRPEAERTVEALVQQHDLPRERVQVHAAGTENATAGTTDQRSEEHHGFLASVGDLPDDDRATYEEGLRRGGILVSVQVAEEQVDRMMGVFEQHGAIDLDARKEEWRQAGWTGGSMAGATAGMSPDATTTPSLPTHGGDAVLGGSSEGTRSGAAATPGTGTAPRS